MSSSIKQIAYCCVCVIVLISDSYGLNLCRVENFTEEIPTRIFNTTPRPKSRRLETVPLESQMISTSGISSGGVSATNFYLSNSRLMIGLATYASLLYMCGNGSIFNVAPCLSGETSVNRSVNIAEQYSLDGKIDSLHNLKDKKHFIYHGTNDHIVKFVNGALVSEFFLKFSKHVFFRQSDSIHSMPTKTCGIGCSEFPIYSGVGCAKCNFSAVYEGMNYIYDFKLKEPTDEKCRSTENMDGLELVDQSEFFVPFHAKASMLSDAVLYTPPQCRVQPSKCNLHVAFHGCRHSIENDGIDYIKCSGYLEVADANDLIILFPQIKRSVVDISTLFHCWDLHGYSGQFYGTRYGSQNQVVLRMVNRILGVEDKVYEDFSTTTDIPSTTTTTTTIATTITTEYDLENITPINARFKTKIKSFY